MGCPRPRRPITGGLTLIGVPTPVALGLIAGLCGFIPMIGPLVGAGMLTWLLVLSVRDLADPANSYTGQAWLGVGPPLVIGVAVMAAGVVLMLAWRRRDARFWRERASAAP